jgi:coiled-coil domain-containing protein 130
MQGFNMGRYIPPASLDRSLSSKPIHGFNEGASRPSQPTIRFEMPFDIWCTTCKPEALIPQGIRFNAEKKTVGKYYSTPIFSFRMKHGACGGTIEIRTDPQSREYVVHEGGRRRAVLREENNDGVFGEILTEEERRHRIEDAFARIEGKKTQEVSEKSEQDQVKELYKERNRRWRDDYSVNQGLRRTFRTERKRIAASDAEKASVAERLSLGIKLVDAAKSDDEIASRVRFGNPQQTEKDRLLALNRPVFSKPEDRRSGTISTHGKTNAQVRTDAIKKSFLNKVRTTQRLHTDPWSNPPTPSHKEGVSFPRLKRKRSHSELEDARKLPGVPKPCTDDAGVGNRGARKPAPALVDYGSDSDD